METSLKDMWDAVYAFGSVLILPMRNGNSNEPKENLVKNGNPVLILPMRNGNISNPSKISLAMRFCSYPTYEEWKLRKYRKSNELT